MATPDGISTEDWDVVHELALENVDATVSGDDLERRECRGRLLTYLDTLEEKYGELPSILATRADYIDDLRQKEELLNRAYILAKSRADVSNELEIAHSLAKLYIEVLKDTTKGYKWLECLRQHIGQRGDSLHKEEYEQLSEAGKRLHEEN